MWDTQLVSLAIFCFSMLYNYLKSRRESKSQGNGVRVNFQFKSRFASAEHLYQVVSNRRNFDIILLWRYWWINLLSTMCFSQAFKQIIASESAKLWNISINSINAMKPASSCLPNRTYFSRASEQCFRSSAMIYLTVFRETVVTFPLSLNTFTAQVYCLQFKKKLSK